MPSDRGLCSNEKVSVPILMPAYIMYNYMYMHPRSDRGSDCKFAYFKRFFSANELPVIPISQFAPGYFLSLNELKIICTIFFKIENKSLQNLCTFSLQGLKINMHFVRGVLFLMIV